MNFYIQFLKWTNIAFFLVISLSKIIWTADENYPQIFEGDLKQHVHAFNNFIEGKKKFWLRKEATFIEIKGGNYMVVDLGLRKFPSQTDWRREWVYDEFSLESWILGNGIKSKFDVPFKCIKISTGKELIYDFEHTFPPMTKVFNGEEQKSAGVILEMKLRPITERQKSDIKAEEALARKRDDIGYQARFYDQHGYWITSDGRRIDKDPYY